MDFELARFNMLEQQVRPWEVLDPRVVEVMAALPRERFVPPEFREIAFADIPIPIGSGEVLLPAMLQGRILQALDVRSDDKVLEIGTGTGYLTALLARLGGHVYSVEIRSELSAVAAVALGSVGVHNFTLEIGDAAAGWERHAPYDAIAVTGSLPVLPDGLPRQLRLGGRLCVVVGDAPAMQMLLIRRVGEDQWAEESLLETNLPPLTNAPQRQRFVF
jgi:protein-L-isoaspartate(D-aspartate) O-methyltransferase